MSPLSVTDLSRRAWMQRSLWAGAGLASAALAGEAARAQPVPGGPVRAAAPAWLAQRWPQAALQGQGRMRFWGLQIYDALLWVQPGFDPARFDAYPFALELVYLRALDGGQIAERSLTEMRPLPGFDASRADPWLARMKQLFPDVKAQDRLAGLHLPGQGAQFVLNGQLRGEVADPLFARLFFGIWLAPQTSEPRLRQSLVGGGVEGEA